jgi:hypothetical protein
MRAGEDTPYGSFPEYVSGGFGFANNSSFSGTTEQVPFPSPPADLGSNKVGGGKSKKGKKTRKNKKQRGGDMWQATKTLTGEFFNRPILATQNVGIQPRIYDTQMFTKGHGNFPSPRPEVNPLTFASRPPVYTAYVSPSSVKF